MSLYEDIGKELSWRAKHIAEPFRRGDVRILQTP